MKIDLSMRVILKHLSIAAALSGALVALPSVAAEAQASTTATQNAIHEKTRAQVYQELVKAKQSGELARLDKTYAGS